LKLLGAKSRDFAESFVFKQLIVCLFRRFPRRLLAAGACRSASRGFALARTS